MLTLITPTYEGADAATFALLAPLLSASPHEEALLPTEFASRASLVLASARRIND